MRLPLMLVVLLAFAIPASAQSSTDEEDAVAADPCGGQHPAEAAAAPVAPVQAGSPQVEPFFRSLGRDYRSFFTSVDTGRTMVVFGSAALSVSKWDAPATRSANANWSDDVFGPGRVAGGAVVQLAFAGGTYLFGRMSDHAGVERLGSRLLRAQIVSQSVVQAAKFATHRARPDRSNHQSLPSGHSASAFATATVLQGEFGWKVGVPAYALAAWVAASRMEANKHYMSDVFLGAGVGIASAHSVTVHVGQKKLSLGVAPTEGGAAVTFTTR